MNVIIDFIVTVVFNVRICTSSRRAGVGFPGRSLSSPYVLCSDLVFGQKRRMQSRRCAKGVYVSAIMVGPRCSVRRLVFRPKDCGS